MAGKWLRASGGNWLRGDGTSIWLRNPPPLYHLSTQTNGITSGGVACYDLSTTQGSTPDTATVTATNSGTDIQWTKSAGGNVLVFATGRVPAGGWTFTNAELAVWARQSIAAVNAGLRVRFYKWSSGTETLIGGSPHDDGIELANYSQEMVWAADATDTALAEDERLLVKYYLTNVGTMAAGEALIRFNGGTSNEAKLIVKHEFCTSFVNLTDYGAEDGHSYDAAGNVIRKTGGGSLITVTGYDYDLSITSAYNGFSGVFLARQVTTTDFTASNITNKSDCAFLSFPNTVRKGVRITAPADLQERTLTILLPHTMAAGQTEAINLIASVSGTGAPESVTLNPAPTPGVDTDATVTITYAAGQAGQTLTVDFYPNASATAGTRYVGYRGAHITAVASAKAINESRLQLYPEVDFKAESSGVTLTLSDSTHGHTADAVLLSTDSLLAVQDALHSHAADNVVLTAQSSLTINESLHAHAADSLALTSETALVIAEALHASLADSPVLTVASMLAIAEAVHSHIADNIGLSSETVLVIAEALHAHAADNLTLGTASGVDLVIAESLHAHAAENLALTLQSLLAVQDALHSHAADNADLATQLSLAIAEALHGHLADNLTLSITTGLSLVIAKALHAHAADNLALTSETALVIAEAASAHLADSPVISVASVLAVAEALHVLSSDNLALNIGAALLVNETLHSHSADNLDFTLQSSLEVAEALHAHLADNITLSIAETLAIIDALHSHAADNVGLTFVEILYVFGQRGAYSNRAAAQNMAERLNQQTNTRSGNRSTGRRR